MKEPKTINIKMKWQTAVMFYIQTLQNPNASHEAVDEAKEDLMKLAKAYDAIGKEREDEVEDFKNCHCKYHKVINQK